MTKDTLVKLEERQSMVNHESLHYYVSSNGKKKNVVLVHGLGVSSRYMLPLAKELSIKHNVYAIDLPGFGKSQRAKGIYNLDTLANTLHAFIQSQALNNLVMVGNSFGCQVIVRFMKVYPDIPLIAILIGPTMNKFERNMGLQMLRWVQNLKYEPNKAMVKILTKDILDCGLIRVFRTLSLGVRDTPEVGLNIVSNPILFVRGSLDPIVPKRWLDYLAGQNPLFRTAELADAGHAVNFNSPKPMADIIESFITTKK